ncbi:Hpt domain-containing protein [Qipengyuania marisflavi]|uniref:Hpt domain-containing protein n=1 Tax=Qipengyuania marisflavi TaxID=2486356 RepID=A0A5S3P957_9SPHN|nr:Hpt domain-containing protein [Qipengyuania marisflavi]TMM49978.1 Hpt domain-containing protein [Qipengyuania marisflavi]
MEYEFTHFDASLAAAAGEDADLRRELKGAFLDSATQLIDLLGRARCDGNWHAAATRLRDLAASFHASELLDLARTAEKSAPGEPTIVTKLRNFLAEFEANPAI